MGVPGDIIQSYSLRTLNGWLTGLRPIPLPQHCVQYTWMNYMMTSSHGNIFRVTGLCAGNSPVPGEFTAQRPVTRSFDVFCDLHPNKRLSKQWWGWWFATPLCPLWRHINERKNQHPWYCFRLNEMIITVTSYWARWRLKSPASRLLTKPFIQAQIKENTKAPRHWPLVRGIHQWPANSLHKWPVARRMFPFDGVIMI